MVAERVRRLAFEGDLVLLETSRERGKLVARQTVPGGTEAPCWITLAPEAEIVDNRSAVMGRLKPFKAEALQEGRVRALGTRAWSDSTGGRTFNACSARSRRRPAWRTWRMPSSSSMSVSASSTATATKR